jgi:neutral ceramidase
MKNFALAVCVALAAAAATAQDFKAGYAERDITPPAGLPMWGYGARHDLPATGTKLPLYAKCVVIEADGEKLALMGLDLGRSPTFAMMEKIREGVAQSGVKHLLLSGSHTHHGPVIEFVDKPGMGQGKFDNALEYIARLTQDLTDCINEAAANAVPAKIGWGSREVPFNRNRQSKKPDPIRDPELAVIRLDALDGKPIAVAVNFAAHPVWEDILDRRWSSEYPHFLQKTVTEATGAPCLFLQGAAGDMSPNGQGANGVEELGAKIGGVAAEIAHAIETKVPAKPSLKATQEEKFEFETRIDLQNPLIRATFKQMFFPEIMAMLEELPGNTISPRLNTVLLNDELALVGGSGEFFAAHSVRLKQESASPETFFVGYCNGHQMYFPTREAIEEGGYGADPSVSWVPPGAGEQMIDKAVANIAELMKQ